MEENSKPERIEVYGYVSVWENQGGFSSSLIEIGEMSIEEIFSAALAIPLTCRGNIDCDGKTNKKIKLIIEVIEDETE